MRIGRRLAGFNGAPASSPGKQVDDVRRREHLRVASMEPRLRRRGNSARCLPPSGRTASLQWSPGFVAGETRSPPPATVRETLLQWSPGFVAGETCQSWRAVRPRCRASMEPRLRRRGNHRVKTAMRTEGRCFNGAPASSPGKPANAHISRSHLQRASMEPRLRRRGNRAWRPRSTGCATSFNGAPASSPGKRAGGDRALGSVLASMEPRLRRRGNVARP